MFPKAFCVLVEGIPEHWSCDVVGFLRLRELDASLHHLRFFYPALTRFCSTKVHFCFVFLELKPGLL